MPDRLSRINHFVVVMLENRSFDNLLGFLYSDQNKVSPTGLKFEGLTGTESSPDTKGKPVQVFKIQQNQKLIYFYPRADPGEGFANTNVQLFGTNPQPAGAGDESGIPQKFSSQMGLPKAHTLPGTQASDIMGMYTPQMLPILSGLARGYAVCDYWFSSAPTQTFPNRAFVAMATSQGRLTDAPAPFTAPSIYTLLAKKGNSWAMYGYNQDPLALQSIADITNAPNSLIGSRGPGGLTAHVAFQVRGSDRASTGGLMVFAIGSRLQTADFARTTEGSRDGTASQNSCQFR
jgi:phospholipase C